MQLIKRQKVSASFTDSNANLSVMGAFQIVEDAVTEFMGDLKIDGITAKREYNAVWVFAKTKIKFLKNIVWNEEYVVTSFISKISNVTMFIDAAIKNASGELCVYSRIELCALDVETGRIRKVSTVGVGESIKVQDPLMEITFAKISAEELPVVEEVRVGYTNIDFVGHTNNKEYVRFMLNTYSVKDMKNNPIREMEIVYINQSYEGDLLTVRKGSSGDKDVFAIEKNGKTITKCEILRTAV